jgi:hypothetical protein
MPKDATTGGFIPQSDVFTQSGPELVIPENLTNGRKAA